MHDSDNDMYRRVEEGVADWPAAQPLVKGQQRLTRYGIPAPEIIASAGFIAVHLACN